MRNIESNPALLVKADASIREALKQIDLNKEGILFVVDAGKRLIGALTDGDIRRSLINGKALTESISGTFNPDPFFLFKNDYSNELAKKKIIEKRFEVIPLLTDDRVIVGYVTWDDLLTGVERRGPGRVIDVPVVIMAGGKGTRMAPFTNVLPKPLIPIGEKTILEIIIDAFRRFGVMDYYFTINFRGEMIRAYFDCIEKDYRIHYLKEDDFWGTAGSLTLLPPNFSKTFIVSNCDIVVNADFAEVLDFHRKSGSALTVISSIQHHQVPYGVINFEAGGRVNSIQEKPEFSFCINTGVYILESECIDFIKKGQLYHMTHLMDDLLKAGKRVSTYPVNESEYIDIGQWEEYRNAVKQMAL
jgi:dTDP-glucose pyrophosphorylase